MVREVATVVGRVIADLVNFRNPVRIVLSGPVVQCTCCGSDCDLPGRPRPGWERYREAVSGAAVSAPSTRRGM